MTIALTNELVGVKCNLSYPESIMPYREKFESRLARFMAKVKKCPDTGCWEWQGSLTPGGYGQVGFRGRLWVAHRAFWVFMGNPDPEEKDLDDLCRNRKCINPDHLEVVTRSENLRRGFEARGCKNGHPYSEEGFSIVRRSDGQIERRCKICHRERNRRAKARAKDRARE